MRGRHLRRTAVMANTLAVHHRSNRPVTARLHPAVYKFAAGLVLLFVVSAWAFFYQQGDPQLLLGMVTELLFVAVAIPFLLWLTWRRHRTTEEVKDATEVTSLRAWMFGDFDTWQGRLRA